MGRARKPSRRSQRWPTVDEQLRDARAIHGSALEHLIRENQTFELLHPREANDGLPVPLWLRVHWRKHHPKEVPDESSPAAAYPYPDVLDSIYEWMRIHQDLPGWEEKSSSRRRPSRGGGSPRRGGAT